MFLCLHCGSRNHRSDDCLSPERTFVPEASEPPQDDVQAPASLTQEAVVNAIKPEPALWHPRWPGGPSICSSVNLPAFEMAKEAVAYSVKYCGQAGPREVTGKCPACGMLHLKLSKSKRPQYPAGFKPREPKRAAAPQRTMEPDLPKREVAAKPAGLTPKLVVAPKRETPGQGAMF